MNDSEEQTRLYPIHAWHRVIDGDSIDVTLDLGFDTYVRKRVRLRNIDAPECRGGDHESKRQGFLAKAKLGEWCRRYHQATANTKANGLAVLSVPVKRGTDKFGRVLGELWVSTLVNEHDDKENVPPACRWTSVNEWMCRNGYAVHFDGRRQARTDADVQNAHMENRRRLQQQEEKEQQAHDLAQILPVTV